MMTLIWSLTLQMNFYLEILVNTDRLVAGAGLGPARHKSTFLITAPFTPGGQQKAGFMEPHLLP